MTNQIMTNSLVDSSRTPPQYLYISDLQAYTAKTGNTLMFRIKDDLYSVDAQSVRLKLAGPGLVSIQPRIAFQKIKGKPPGINLSDLLVPMPQMPDDVRFHEREPSAFVEIGDLYSWEQMVARLDEFSCLTPQPSGDGMNFERLLIESRVIRQEDLDRAKADLQMDESPGMALIRLRLCTAKQMIDACSDYLGLSRVTRPTGKLGERLVSAGLITNQQLRDALSQQVLNPQPLGQILARYCGQETIDRYVQDEGEVDLKVGEEGRLGELLVHRGLISRTDLVEAMSRQKRSGEPLGQILTRGGSTTSKQIEEILELQSIKRELLKKGGKRLGDFLVGQGSLEFDALKEALAQQVHDKRPLGEILIALKLCSPEEVINGLLALDAYREQQAERLLARKIRETSQVQQDVSLASAPSSTFYRANQTTSKGSSLPLKKILLIIVGGIGTLAIVYSVMSSYVSLPSVSDVTSKTSTKKSNGTPEPAKLSTDIKDRVMNFEDTLASLILQMDDQEDKLHQAIRGKRLSEAVNLHDSLQATHEQVEVLSQELSDNYKTLGKQTRANDLESDLRTETRRIALIHTSFAQFLLDFGDKTGAKKALKKALEKDPNNQTAQKLIKGL